MDASSIVDSVTDLAQEASAAAAALGMTIDWNPTHSPYVNPASGGTVSAPVVYANAPAGSSNGLIFGFKPTELAVGAAVLIGFGLLLKPARRLAR